MMLNKSKQQNFKSLISSGREAVRPQNWIDVVKCFGTCENPSSRVLISCSFRFDFFGSLLKNTVIVVKSTKDEYMNSFQFIQLMLRHQIFNSRNILKITVGLYFDYQNAGLCPSLYQSFWPGWWFLED